MFQDFNVLNFLFLACFCFLAAVIDAISGGGGLISLPAYFAVGFPPHVALGTNKVSSTLSTIASSFKFWKSKKVNVEIVSKLFIFSFVGAILGALTTISIEPKYFKPISFITLILVFLYTLKNKNIGEVNHYKGITFKTLLIGKIMAFFLGLYDGFLGPGTGSFLIFCLIKIFKVDFSFASGNTKILNLSSNFASLIVFTILGKSNFLYGVPIAIIMSFGAILGAKLAILKGNKFIKPVFLVVTIVLILKISYEFFF